MELIRGLSGAHRRADGCVLTIGAYDGIHLGHQALLARLHEHAARCGAAAVLLTFEPMPREYLAPADPPDRKSTRLNSSHSQISYAVFCLKKKKAHHSRVPTGHRHPRPRAHVARRILRARA